MADILVITTTEHNDTTGRDEIIASHGVNLRTEENVILPCEHPKDLGAHFSKTYNEWVIPEISKKG